MKKTYDKTFIEISLDVIVEGVRFLVSICIKDAQFRYKNRASGEKGQSRSLELQRDLTEVLLRDLATWLEVRL